MASHAVSSQQQSDPNRDNLPVVRSRAQAVPEDRLPLTEFLFDRAGAASPFGDDLRFPLPVSELTYVHPTEDADPQHL
jgi:succinate dehydrogenase / fumarate reductase iron-sulfur subunit